MMISPGHAMAALFPAQFERLRHELHHSLIDFQNGLRATQGRLALNVWSREGEVIAHVELPGLEPEQLQVDIHENTVRITAQTAEESKEPHAGTWLKREREQADSQRELQLPFAIDAERSTATYDKGILELHLFSQAPVGQVRLPVQRRAE